MFDVVEIDASTWQEALAVTVREDQLAFVADHQPVALVILAKCHVRPGGQVWTPYLARQRGEPVGVAATAADPDGELAHLRHVAVDHRHQGRGIGRLLVEAVVDAAVAAHPTLRAVQVTTHPENEVARRLYERAGFRPTGSLSGIEPVLRRDLGRH